MSLLCLPIPPSGQSLPISQPVWTHRVISPPATPLIVLHLHRNFDRKPFCFCAPIPHPARACSYCDIFKFMVGVKRFELLLFLVPNQVPYQARRYSVIPFFKTRFPHALKNGRSGGTRTPIVLLPRGPKPRASANSATDRKRNWELLQHTLRRQEPIPLLYCLNF